MVNNHSSALGRNGIQDWLLLRTSAVIIMLYIFYILGFIIMNTKLNYEIWYNFFNLNFTKVFTILTLFSILIHGWIGIWQVLTDYVKLISIRYIIQIIAIIVLLSYVIFGCVIVCGG
ncbi:MAG: succinate dehydrogenase, hydrophobic membrane anchor protein [Pantoea sp. Brub]|nr:succinate dehydrogenase, hydrophobic membrane anchor protein [Pantoea sp. Brub]